VLKEMFEIGAADGWRLRGELVAPDEPRAVAIVGHAMMVDRRTLDRPRGRGLVSRLVERGLAVVWPDLRGHGASGPRADEGGRWSYDDLVEDVASLVELARSRWPRLRAVAVGHSLFGHVTLAHLARHPELALDGLVLLACNVAHPAWRRRPIGFVEKAALIELMALLTRAFGRFPSRLVRIGSDDEARPYVEQFRDWCRAGDWRARDGFSYWQALDRVRAPVLAIAGAGDKLMAPAADASALVERVPGARFEVAGRASGLSFNPGHMAVVLDERCRPLWDRIADFVTHDIA
jgi:predicted alpha/beta hydrolase